jgi:hypothetical protein
MSEATIQDIENNLEKLSNDLEDQNLINWENV